MTPEILPKRKDIRLKNYDYKKNGYYFVTICTHNKKPLCYQYENIISRILYLLPVRFPGLEIDYQVIMPTHIHAILIFDGVKVALGEVIRTFKALVSKESNRKRIWQRGYYEHVIRGERALLKIREYIQNNPLIEDINFKQFYLNGLDESNPYKKPDKI
ncbi:transposase [bacterium]|nr:transposase [bacterium]